MQRRLEDYRNDCLTPGHQSFLAEHFPMLGALGTVGKADRVESVYDSRSYAELYLRQKSRLQEFVDHLSRSR